MRTLDQWNEIAANYGGDEGALLKEAVTDLEGLKQSLDIALKDITLTHKHYSSEITRLQSLIPVWRVIDEKCKDGEWVFSVITAALCRIRFSITIPRRTGITSITSAPP